MFRSSMILISYFLFVGVNLAGSVTTIADNSTIRPETGTPFQDSIRSFPTELYPQISNGSVAFAARTSSTSNSFSLYYSRGGSLQFIAGVGTATPDSSGYTFKQIDDFQLFNNSVVFRAESGSDTIQESGIYLWKDGALSTIANDQDLLPGIGTLRNFGGVAIQGDRIAFTASLRNPPFSDLPTESLEAVSKPY